MGVDIREAAAKFYDLQPSPFNGQDISLYISLIPTSQSQVLELGCGTGRVLVPLARHCAYIHGVDISESMLAICRHKLAHHGIPPAQAQVELADICRLDLGRAFDVVIAPFRVFQNLETDEQVEGFFQTLHTHLRPGGSGILNVFRPRAGEATVRQMWAEMRADKPCWEQPLGAGRLVGYERIAHVHGSKLICYPVLSYRYYEGDALKEEAALTIAMRCYYPDEFERLIVAHGFQVLNKWGGYHGEAYGEGPELVIQFTTGDAVSPSRTANHNARRR
jgi:SAM-dependent methyltransferase